MIEVENKKVPHSFRNKYLRNSGSVSFSTSTPAPVSGGGSKLDVLKADDTRIVSDDNVLSSLRTLLEIKSRIIALADTEAIYSDDNTFSSLKTSKELNKINDAIDALKDLYLSKVNDDRAKGHLILDGGVTSDLLQSKEYFSGSLGTGFILKRDPNTGKSRLEVDELYVRMKAIFDSLTIKELRSVGGEILLTLASIECTKVEYVDSEPLYDSDGARLLDSEGYYLSASLDTPPFYRCFFTADDGNKAILNQFVAGDFAQCRQFDIKPGVYEGVSNRYYWRYVIAVGDNYIDLSIDDCMEGSDIPQAGDKIIQLGNRTDPSRQNAILLSAYGLTAPTIQMLQGIDSYSLDGKAVKEEGFDQDTQEFYSKLLGRSYVGARDKSSYIQFAPATGLEIHGAKVDVSADSFTINDSDGNQIAVFEIGEDGRPRLKAENINADELLSNGDKWALKKEDGGYLASKNIVWDDFGNLEILGSLSLPYKYFPINKDGTPTLMDLSKGRYFIAQYTNPLVSKQIIELPIPAPKYNGTEVRIYSGFRISRMDKGDFDLIIEGNAPFFYPGYIPALGSPVVISKIRVSNKEIVLRCISLGNTNSFWYIQNYNDFTTNDFNPTN